MSKPDKALLYLLTFSNGKMYVGQTSKSIEQRLRSHAYCSRKKPPKLPVHSAWASLGAPSVCILAEGEWHSILELERAAIVVFNTQLPNGYNCTPGGEASPMHSPHVAAKVSEKARSPEGLARQLRTHLGAKRSEEARRNMAISHVGKHSAPKSEAHKQAIRAAHLALPARPRGVRKNSAETIQKMRVAALNRWARERVENV